MYNTLCVTIIFPVFSNPPHQDENDSRKLILVDRISQLAVSIYPRVPEYVVRYFSSHSCPLSFSSSVRTTGYALHWYVTQLNLLIPDTSQTHSK